MEIETFLFCFSRVFLLLYFFLLRCLHAILFWTCFWQFRVFWLEQMLCLDCNGIVLVWLKQCVWVCSVVFGESESSSPLVSLHGINDLKCRGAIQATLPAHRPNSELWSLAILQSTVWFGGDGHTFNFESGRQMCLWYKKKIRGKSGWFQTKKEKVTSNTSSRWTRSSTFYLKNPNNNNPICCFEEEEESTITTIRGRQSVIALQEPQTTSRWGNFKDGWYVWWQKE